MGDITAMLFSVPGLTPADLFFFFTSRDLSISGT